ncbi:hypothetical protein F4820DRAFT_152473 [Hypoxylon rubiginosum]|uniref:Uncharacterized protein n=1 Tax=Hypoxylon rubiginosum TaxID=110542 RepID=A0ACB9Z9F1_9PEZI|nr:hypothetical protein F4820DRAFT_152473 [Hypoxylon rubiginosum]
MESHKSKHDVPVASQSARDAHQAPGELEPPPPYASHDIVPPDSHPTASEQPYVSQSHPLLEFAAGDDGYVPPERMSAEGRPVHAEACCCSTTGGCCCSSNGGCCFSDHEGCCFSDNGSCCFSDNGGCCFSDNGGCCFSNRT